MNVMFVHQDTCLYGASQSLLALIEGLRGRGHTCSVVLPEAGPLVGELERRGIAHDVLVWHGWTAREQQWLPRRVASGVKRLCQDLRLVDAAAQRCGKDPPDLIHTNSSKTPFGAMLARRMGVPHTWHFREFLGGPYSVGQVFSLGRRVSCELIQAWSSALVFISHALKKQFDGVVNRIPVHVVYNGILSRAELQQCGETPLPDSDVLTLCLVGRFDAWKHPLVALQAVHLLTQRGEKVKLIVAGGGGENDVRAVTGFVRQHHLAETVEFLGFVKDVRPVFARCHVMLMCSTGDAFGRVTAEAMAFGRPVIGADAGATPELVRHGHDGLLFRAGDAADLAEKITFLMRQRDRIQALGANAAEKAQREFTVERYTAAMEGIFAQCLG